MFSLAYIKCVNLKQTNRQKTLTKESDNYQLWTVYHTKTFNVLWGVYHSCYCVWLIRWCPVSKFKSRKVTIQNNLFFVCSSIVMFYFNIWRVNEHIEYLLTAPPLKISHSTYSEWFSAAKSCQQQHTCSFKLKITSINCFISLNIKLRISVQWEILYACYQIKAGFPIQNNTRDLKMTGIII